MLTNAARYSCSEASFGEEIQQLGLPKDHAAAMCRVLQTQAAAIRQKLIDKSFRSECDMYTYSIVSNCNPSCAFPSVNELQSIRNITSLGETPPNCATLELKISQELVDGLPTDTTHILNIESAQLATMLEEMKMARDIMMKYENKESAVGN